MSQIPRRTAVAAAAAAIILAATPAFAQKKYDTGASDSTIRLGTSMPLSGPVSSFGVIGRGIEAYFKRLNEQGGVNGRKVEIFIYDDEYSPPKAVEVTRKLVEQDQVLATFGVLGTGVNSATQKYLNAKGVPQLFIGTGATKWNDPKHFPWTVPFVTSYGAESKFFAQHILQTRPAGKIAVLYQNDDMGKDMLRGLKAGLGDKASMIVAEQSYETSDPTVDSQVLALKASGADIFINFSTGRFAPQAVRKAFDIGWKPAQQYLPLIANYVAVTYAPAGFDKSIGVMSTATTKDPSQARWANDAGMQDYRALMKKYLPSEDAGNQLFAYAYMLSETMTHVLRSCGDDLTRANVLKHATNLKFRSEIMLPGIEFGSTSSDYEPYRAFQMVRFNGREIEPFGDAVRLK